MQSSSISVAVLNDKLYFIESTDTKLLWYQDEFKGMIELLDHNFPTVLSHLICEYTISIFDFFKICTSDNISLSNKYVETSHFYNKNILPNRISKTNLIFKNRNFYQEFNSSPLRRISSYVSSNLIHSYYEQILHRQSLHTKINSFPIFKLLCEKSISDIQKLHQEIKPYKLENYYIFLEESPYYMHNSYYILINKSNFVKDLFIALDYVIDFSQKYSSNGITI